jgi:alpha-tubulin suppressor-like RCC1 family protein
MRKASLVGVALGALGCFGIVACGDDDASVPVESGDPSTPPSGTKDAGARVDDDEPVADAGKDAARVDVAAPEVTILTPREDVVIAERRFVVTGTATDDIGVAKLSYVIGDKAPVTVPVAADGTFTFTFEPVPGNNTFAVTAVDASGKETKRTRSAYFGHRISVGNSQAAMLANGKLFTWGRNENGQLGNGTLVGTWSADETIVLPRMYEQPAADLVSIVTRQTFMIALAKDGTVKTWGNNTSGQLGYSTPVDCGSKGDVACGRSPASVPGITDAVAVAAGFDHSLVLRADGTVLAFGANDKGQLGLTGVTSTITPTAVPGLSNVVALAAGSAHSVALTSEGKVFVWGSNQYGQNGSGTSDTAAHPTPAEVPGLIGASIASANYTMLVRKPDGTVVAWGQNQNGQVGNGTTTTVLTPSPVLVSVASEGVPAVALKNIESIAADGFVSLALDHEGNGYAWGLGGLGQLGQGFLPGGDRDLANRTVASPLYVAAADKPSFVLLELEVGAGGPAFARTTQNKVFGWGWSFQGSLGGGTTLLNAWAYTAPRLVYPY